MRHAFVMASALVLLAAAAPAAAQTATANAGASVCPHAPRTGEQVRCTDLVPGTSLTVLGSPTDQWLQVQWSGGKGYVNRDFVTVRAGGPCADSLYQALRKQPLEQLTEREYQYMLERDRACTEFQRSAMTSQPTQQVADEVRKVRRTWQTFIFIGLFLSAASVLYVVATGS